MSINLIARFDLVVKWRFEEAGFDLTKTNSIKLKLYNVLTRFCPNSC